MKIQKREVVILILIFLFVLGYGAVTGQWLIAALPIVAMLIVGGGCYGLVALLGALGDWAGRERRSSLSMMHYPREEFDALQTEVENRLAINGNNSLDVSRKFASFIGANPDNEELPTHLYRCILKKILFEYNRKHGSLKLSSGTVLSLPSVEDVLRPLSNEESLQFRHFCVDNLEPKA